MFYKLWVKFDQSCALLLFEILKSVVGVEVLGVSKGVNKEMVLTCLSVFFMSNVTKVQNIEDKMKFFCSILIVFSAGCGLRDDFWQLLAWNKEALYHIWPEVRGALMQLCKKIFFFNLWNWLWKSFCSRFSHMVLMSVYGGLIQEVNITVLPYPCA